MIFFLSIDFWNLIFVLFSKPDSVIVLAFKIIFFEEKTNIESLPINISGIYGNTTMGQIKDGKHMYRALEAHMTLYLALSKNYLEHFVEQNIEIEKDLREAVASAVMSLSNDETLEQERLRTNTENVLEALRKTDFQAARKKFDDQLQGQARFYRNYMSLFEILLLFIRASRQQCWELHLEALNAMVPYFFAFDMLNYARLTPVYLSQMAELKEKDRVTWQLFERGNFSVNKSSVAFTAIGADHALEQQNRAMKVLGGIKGIANNQTALDEFFMTAGEMSLILDQFADRYDLRGSKNAKEHYQLSGTKNKRISDNTNTLLSTLDFHNLSFENTDNLFNVVTNKIMPNDQSLKFLGASRTGTEKYNLFIEESRVR